MSRKKAKKKAAYEAKKNKHFHGPKASTQVHKSKKDYNRQQQKRIKDDELRDLD